ncbi:MAG TPA: hypothetical protein PKD09_09270 [Aggregatilinea sp.]|uniref:SPL family radical SAM protein n=1 Tax=Aggregatilinea sp. TaxID=2806333 RepID=UPI002CB967D3|nr:radical SAM protein [Aggregatilinea sp.]HML21826.1 hypothetical protein [Aggregatilinea sp.]
MDLEEGYYESPRWTYELPDCSMPLTFDTYSNCAHQCLYCFSFFQRAVGDTANDYLHHKVKAVNVEKVKRLFRLELPNHQFNWYIANRHTLQWGGLSDGFDWYERRFRKSLELLTFFNEINYPISVSTKGTWYLDDPAYVEQFQGRKNIHWKISIITADPAQAAKLEPGTPSPKERVEALRRIKELGIAQTTFRLRPFILGASDRTLDELFQMAADAGVDSISTEFLCIEKRATENLHERYRRISNVIGIDLFPFYLKNSYSGSGLFRLNYDLKRPHYDRMMNLSAKHGIPVYISDAHHKEKSEACCCCGIRPSADPVGNYFRGQFSEAIQIARRNGFVRWSDISDDAEGLKNVPLGRAIGYNQGSTFTRAKFAYHTIYDFMRALWNNPKSWQSPARYFGGVLVPAESDDSGDLIYLYNRPYVETGYRVASVDELKAMIGYDRSEQ